MNPLQKMGKISPTRISSPLLSGMVYSLICLILIAVTAALLLSWTDMKEESLGMYIYGIHGISLLLGGFVAGKRSGQKGWYYGVTLGILYSLLIFLIGFLGFDAALKTHFLILAAVAVTMGALGGIIGVNARS